MPQATDSRRVSKNDAASRGLRPDIQGLRMLAVVVVILDHLVGWPSGGFIGVDVFFVISGFLITGLLLREHAKTGTISFLGFYRRRVKRIMPVATLVVALTIALSYFLFNQVRFWQTVWDGVSASLFAANWRFAAVGTDYFLAESGVSPLQHYWSLAVEEQFYFAWPWLMLLILVLTTKLTRWKSTTARTLAGFVMLTVTLASFLWSMADTATAPTWAYFSTFSRAWELGVGALLAIFASVLARLPDRLRPPLAWLGLSTIAVSLFVVSASSSFPAPWAALPVLGTALVICAGTGGPQRFLWPITNPVSRYVGDISYSLYVWHWPIVIFGTQLWGEAPLTQALLLAAIALVSVFSYHLFEDPIRRSAWLESRAVRQDRKRSRSLEGPRTGRSLAVLGLVAAVTASLVAVAIVRTSPTTQIGESSSITPNTLDDSVSTLTPARAELRAQILEATSAQSYPADMSPTMDEAIAGASAPEDVRSCGQVGELVDKAACTWGAQEPTYHAVMVGDSVSMTWVNPLRLAIPDGWSLTSLGTFGCRFINFETPVPPGEDCVNRNADAVEYINESQPDLLIVAHSYWLGSLDGGEDPPTMAEWTDNLENLFSKIDLSQTRVVFLSAPPSPENPNVCFTPLSSPDDCAGDIPPRWKAQATAEDALAAIYSGLVIDTRELFCANNRCPIFVGTTPVRGDLTHMTIAYGEKIVPALQELLAEKDFWAALAG